MDGDTLKLCDKRLRQWLRLPSSEDSAWFGRGRPEINRADLRELLAASLPVETIQWGRRLKSFDAASRTLNFQDGSTEHGFDLVVGADGAWSKVRNNLSNVQPFYSSVGRFTASVLDSQHSVPEVYRLVNRGS